ncbi:MAG: hypothetical protein N2047_04255 [Meiothermus sp.]|nr:hypothetical protein [Meiothermus sp.]
MGQAVLFLAGRVHQGRFESAQVPPEIPVTVGVEGELEGVFSAWPKTDERGEVISIHVNKLTHPAPAYQLLVRGLLLAAIGPSLKLLIGSKSGNFVLSVDRGPNKQFLKPRTAYRIEGRLEGRRLVAQTVALDGPVKEALAPKAPPKPVVAPPKPARPAPPPKAPELPMLKRGQMIGIVGKGPYYLVVNRSALPTWWPRIERHLELLDRRYQVVQGRDGSRGIVVDDPQALHTWYARVRRAG